MPTRYFEDFQVGDSIDLGHTSPITAEEIISFARQYDPQPFHIDPELAKETFFGGLIASGWQTCSLFMRLMVDSLINDTISLGSPGVDEIRWHKPVRPGDALHARLTVISATASRSRSDLGIVRSRSEVFNQKDELVASLAATHFFGRRPTS
jgi:acyl dehydratase